MGEVALIRHVSTKGNKPSKGQPKLHRGQADLPPSPEGLKESYKLAKAFVKQNPDIVAIYTAPLERTETMADEIGKLSGVKVEVVPDINTWNTGKLAGRPMDEVKPVLKAYSADKRDEKFPAMKETFEQFLKRWLHFLSKKLDHNKKGVIVICTQGTNIGTALQWDKAGRPEEVHKFKFDYDHVETIPTAHWVVMKEDSGKSEVRNANGPVELSKGIVS